MRVVEWMSPDPVTVDPDTDVGEARRLLTYYGVRHLPVVSSGRVVGMISDRDVRIHDEVLEQALLGRLAEDRPTVEARMSAPVHCIDSGEAIEAAARRMLSHRISALPVVDGDGQLIGLITTTDCLLASLSAGADTGGVIP